LRKLVASIIFIFSAQISIFSQKILKGSELSQNINNYLAEKHFSVIQQPLASTGRDQFAYNMLLEFNADTPQEEDFSNTDSLRKDLVFCFTQEDFYDHKEEILDFLTVLKDLPRNWNATVLFSALDNIAISQHSLSGTKIFAESVLDSDSTCALLIGFDPNSGTGIFTGSKKITTPLWLTKRISDAFYYSRINFSFENKLSAIYRLGIVNGKKRLGYFFMNNIPAIEINLSDISQIKVLKKFAETYTPEGTKEWDMHYLFIKRGNIFKVAFINERSLIFTYFSVALLTILILCVFSFTGTNGEKHKYEFIKSSYMIPFTIALSLLSLLTGQHIVMLISRFQPMNPIFQYGIKIIFSMVFVSLLFTVQGILKISITAFMYGYILLVVAIFNIFLFSARDLTLFVIFAAEYAIIYISRTAKSIPALIFYFILMLLPFLPYGFIIISHAEDRELLATVYSTVTGNLLLSFAIFPFQITWLRMLIFMNVLAGIKGYTMRKMVFTGILATIAVLLFCFALIFGISRFIYDSDFRKIQNIKTIINRDEKFTLSAKLEKDQFSGMNTNHIQISSEENALWYDVTITGSNNVHPIYDSIYNYKIEQNSAGNDVYSFTIPAYPPKNIRIDYAADSGSKALVQITAFYETDSENELRTEIRELKVE
ncbi:MAG: hypothetical protein IJ727_12695, partial [Treponema sp.]|nr:hypothetical protein [Treponema sp.]